MLNLTVGHTDTASIIYLDANGNPMLTTPVPDAPPTWVDPAPPSPAVDTITPSADGNTCVIVATAPGTDTVNLSLAVGGKVFTASLQLNISAAPQVLTSVAIANSVS